MLNLNNDLRSKLLLGAAVAATLGLGLTTAASAQQAPPEVVVVTGSLIQGNTSLVSPVTVIDNTTMDQRGISTVQGILQASNLNNGPAVTNNWTANGNFAQGASAISLRALTTNSTLVLFDGMRAAYYPLSDDGSRNFVDLNTIPDDIVDNIQILRDGASAQYGADAIAGVVNVITKKNVQGFTGRAEGGISDRGDAATFRLSATMGWGDMSTDHVNTYISASYYHSDTLYAKDRPYPFNTYNWKNVCYKGACGSDSILNPTDNATFALSTAANFLVRPYNYDPVNNQITTPLPGSRWQNEDGCGPGTSVALTVAQQGAANPASVCQYDYQNLFGTIEPNITRFSLSGHTAFEMPGGIEGTAEANFMQDQVAYDPSLPSTMRGQAPAGIFYPRFRTDRNYAGVSPPAPGSFLLFLPVFVCPERVNCATAADRTLNPNNPFAAAGNPAGIIGRDWFDREHNETRDRTYRVAADVHGTIFDDVSWDVGLTAMHIDLHQEQNGYVYIQHLIDVINDGTFNFTNPQANSAAVRNYVMPNNTSNASSDLAQFQATATKPLWKLWGGDMTLAVGTTVYYEAVDSPSANSDVNGATQRYFVLNAFGTKGSRDVYAAFFELQAPILEQLVVDVSGRYDDYSSGQSHFSPKIGIWGKPFEQLTLRGTYSEGFRIPSFAEANALPTTGFVTNTKVLFNDAYLAGYGCSLATYITCPTYIRNGAFGETTIASPTLKPETSRSFTADATYQLFSDVTLSTTYYNIKKSGAITAPSFAPALAAYYTGAPIPAGYTVLADAPDPNNPLAQPRIASIAAQLINANTIRTSGWDFAATFDDDLTPVQEWMGITDWGTIHLTSAMTATWIRDLETVFPDGTKERYDGTLGNNNLTAGTGTPNWKGNWQNTFSSGPYSVTWNMNWISGYNVSAMDQGTGYRDCGLSDGTRPCRTKDYFTWDLAGQWNYDDNYTFYLSMNNVFDSMPPVDTVATYAITGYNVVTGEEGILGRYIKAGIKVNY